MSRSQDARPRPRRWVRRTLATLAVVLVLAGVLVVVGAWYFSGVLIDGMRIKDSSADFPDTLTAVDDSRVTVTMDQDAEDDPRSIAIAGMRLPSGDYLQVGAVTAADGVSATRSVTRVFGTMPEVGSPTALDSAYYPVDPQQGLGLDFADVQIATPLGPSPAWFVPADGDTWAIFSHGRGATQREGLRLLKVSHEAGLPTLLVTFRDDLVGQPEDGISNFGMTEWPDLEAAVRYALDNGAEDVVLLAASTGAAISLAFLENSDLADAVVGMVFDAPLTSFGQTVDLMAAERGLPVVGWPIPAPILTGAKWLGEQRVAIDFDETDYVSRVDDLTAPTLVLHGSKDGTNPLQASEELAATAPDGVVRLEVFEGAEHVWAWNTDPARFERLVRTHLAEVTAG